MEQTLLGKKLWKISVQERPQIIVNKEKIGGYEALLNYIENTGYNGTGHSF